MKLPVVPESESFSTSDLEKVDLKLKNLIKEFPVDVRYSEEPLTVNDNILDQLDKPGQ